MLSGMGVAGRIVMGTVIRLESEQLSDMETYLENTDEKSILITPELTVKDVIKLENYPVVGFVTEKGGFNSHLAILARKLELTAVIGVPGCMEFIENGDTVLLDGIKGDLVVNPRNSTIEHYMKLKQKLENDQSRINSYAEMETMTLDGYKLALMGNVDDVEDIERVVQSGGEGVGLFRTENLFAQRENLPTEEEQFEIYARAARAMEGKTIVIRTLDAGGDHRIPYLAQEKEENPFLGCRGIRYSLKRPDIFKTQCRAILRASIYGKFRIILPMLCSLAEFRRAKNVISLIKEELDTLKIPYDRDIQLGVMIETPAAAWMADMFAREADFISIGTNDLTQYTIAADRGNKQVAYLYSNYHPAVLRSIRYTIQCCKKEGITVSICGEAAGDSKLLPLLLLFGVDELSVSPSLILKTRRQINELNREKLRGLLEALDNLGSIEETESCIDAFLALS
ncbi:MAG: phosphoenolpyruvate--protein phosphotransferase [Lachnospiraceae bacterium]|nr:phosphoenolpyruvate--protein phosphotransferase [Lachnospiraceae bacterium]MDY4969397.1 phosphoenolpyruvate--protein phosphotransferase [Lachnospiraceae bacterium]